MIAKKRVSRKDRSSMRDSPPQPSATFFLTPRLLRDDVYNQELDMIRRALRLSAGNFAMFDLGIFNDDTSSRGYGWRSAQCIVSPCGRLSYAERQTISYRLSHEDIF
jgi:hypothetical protein